MLTGDPAQVVVIGSQTARRCLPMSECIEIVAAVLVDLANGDAVQPLRQAVVFPGGNGRLSVMPAYVGASRLAGLKTRVLPNAGSHNSRNRGATMVFDSESGRLLAVVEAGAVTEARTAAASAVATRLLARKDSATLAILGSGPQARSHLEAMLLVRPIQRVKVWSRTPDHARLFAENESKGLDVAIDVAASAEEAVRDADMVCTVTSATEPVLEGRWLKPGTHVNAVGASSPPQRELDTNAVVRSRYYVDRRESALNEAHDLAIAMQEANIREGHIVGEIGEVLLGQVPGRSSPEEVTIFRSLGLAVEDLAAAYHVYMRAAEFGVGSVGSLEA